MSAPVQPKVTSKAGTTRPASVAFVGAGPGDPSLLTLRAAQLLATADLVVRDPGVPDELLGHCGPDVEVVDTVGSGDGLSQAARSKLVVDAARAGRQVVRLLAGDPATHGTASTCWSEEARACARAGVPFEAVPGVSPATAVPLHAGIPLTDADAPEAQVVNVGAGEVDWSRYAADTTLVLFGAVAKLDRITRDLVAAGRRPNTPVAVVYGGTTTAQQTVTGSLDRIADEVRAARLDGQAVVVVGEVVNRRETLSWFETKPLFGWQVLVPRTKEQARSLSDQLAAYGAVVSEVPTISVEPPRTPQQMERAVKGLVTGRYEWVAFTSVNAVKAIREKFEEYGLDARAFAGIKVAAVGEQTAAALQAFGVKPDLVPSGEQSARGLLEDWPPYDPVFDPIDRVFLPRADIATETLAAGLVELGWEVDDVTAYRTVRAAPPPIQTREAIKTGKFDAVLFTSSSTVRNLVGIAGKPHTTTVIACIGPQTAKTAEEHGLRVDVMAGEPSVANLAAALAEFGAARRLAAVEAGEPVYRPSQRRPASRRRASK